ncbi:MAG: fibronectin type III domain-containing protein [Verrucomicrobiota bacterium]
MQVSAPTNVNAAAESAGVIRVTWTNAQTTHEFNKVEYRDITGAGSWTTASSTIAAATSTYDITGLSALNQYEVRVSALNTAVAQVDEITAVADLSDSLDGLYFDVYDSAGPVRVWFDVDNSGTSAPSAPTGGRLLEVTGIVTDASATSAATAIASSINGDSEFSASAVGATITITNASTGDRAAISLGTSTFAGAGTTTEGEDGNSTTVSPSASVFTWPSAAGTYWGSRINETTTSWTYIITITGSSPFFDVSAAPISSERVAYPDAVISEFRFGPQITIPSYV